MRDVKAPRRASIHCNGENYPHSQFTIHNSQLSIPSFLNSASLPLARPFTDHTEHAFCSAKKGQSSELGITSKNHHLHTVLAATARHVPTPPGILSERLELADGDFLDMNWHLCARPADTLVVLSHGLEGHARRPHMLGMARGQRGPSPAHRAGRDRQRAHRSILDGRVLST
jgi:hypothetical protein